MAQPTQTKKSSAATSTKEAKFSPGPVPHHMPNHHTRLSSMETQAHMFGLPVAPASSARVLELFSGVGSNLTTQAVLYPDSQFVGIDPGSENIKASRRIAEQLGCGNVEYIEGNLEKTAEISEKFDYVICHQVISFLPEAQQGRLLAAIKSMLKPAGVAYLSFNVYPGWRMKEMVREILRFHTSTVTDTGQRMQHARALLASLAEQTSDNSSYGLFLREANKHLQTQSDAFLAQEYLSSEQNPFYFQQLVSSAQVAGMQYLGETKLSLMMPQNLPPKTREAMQGLNLISQQQYSDFVRGTAQRYSLFCHFDESLNRNLQPSLMEPLHVNLRSKATWNNLDLTSEEAAEFAIGSATMQVKLPLVKAALELLNEAWPAAVAFENLYASSLERIEAAEPAEDSDVKLSRNTLAGALSLAVHADILEAYKTPLAYSGNLETPEVWKIARLQAGHGYFVTNRRMETVTLDALSCFLARNADGKTTMDALAEKVGQAIEKGELVAKHDDQNLDKVPMDQLQQVVTHVVNRLGEASLLC
jgi:methyltransferase-like protein/2-polyprenyl-3-methyl-5-hydroxy-6-metoxy-1,4-benzoquinol methylase